MVQKRITKRLIKIPQEKNDLLNKIVELVNSNQELQTLWEVNNVNAIERLGMSDHGFTHFQIVANIALHIARILAKNSIEMSITKNYELPYSYAQVVIFLASIMHDIGMSINREGHEELSLFLAHNILKQILSFLPDRERIIVTSETLHAILSHRKDGKPITIEAGIIRVADALDMSKGRSRIPFEAGKVNIHSISAYAIDSVKIIPGEKKPIRINILMNNSSGLYQVDELLKKKLQNSGIEEYFEIRAYTENETEKSLIKEFFIES